METKRILITGGTGFIGSQLVKRLRGSGSYEVHELCRYVTGRYSLDSRPGDVVKHYANLADFTAVRNVIKQAQPDYVLHLAAISPVSFSYDHYVEVTEANYTGTINLAEACYREVPNFKQFIFSGTSEMYGMSLRNNDERLTEDSKLVPNSPYAVAKVAAGLYLDYMKMAYGFPMTILRPYNTYGRTNNSHFFIERTITQMLKGDKVYLGDKSAIRDWLYLDDHVDAYVKALGNKRAIGEVIQVCTGKGYTLEETAGIIAKLTNFKGQVIWNSTPKRPLDAQILIGDNSKARKLLGWEPKYTLEEGLKKTIESWRKALA